MISRRFSSITIASRRLAAMMLAVWTLATGMSIGIASASGSVPSPAAAKPVVALPAPAPRTACAIDIVTYDWQDPVLAHRFSEARCEAGGVEVWQYGAAHGIPGAPEGVWGTILAAPYPDDAGHGLRSISFVVSPVTSLVEIEHWYDIESGYDGGNVSLYPEGVILQPDGGYPLSEISASPSYYAWCVDGEPGWSGQSGDWRTDCFDLTPWMGQEVALELDFGADVSVTGMGWYLRRVRIGGADNPIRACCSLDSYACALTTQSACLESGGAWHPEWDSCEPNPCLPALAACCLPDGSCQRLEEAMCLGLGGVWLSEVSGCIPDPCAPPAAPEAPRNLLAETQDVDRIRISWDEGAGSEDLLFVERRDGQSGSWQLVQVLPGQTTSWEDITVQEGFEYVYRLQVANGQGSSPYSNFSGAQAGPVPAAPTGVVTTAISPVRARLSWVDPADNEVGFHVQRMVGEFGPWEVPGTTVPANISSFEIPGLVPTHRYTFRIRAYNQYGWSAWAVSNNVEMPADPGNFAATIHVGRGTQATADAKVYRSRGGADFVHLGDTNASGDFVVPDLRLNDRLRAVWQAQKWQTCRDYTESIGDPEFGMRLFFDTDTRGPNAVYSAFLVETVATDYTLVLAHPIYHVDLAISLEWDVPTNAFFWDDLATGVRQASNYLYNVTDGQMALGKIAVWDCQGWWGEADVRIESHLDRAHADTGQFLDCDCCSSEEHIFIGRSEDGGPTNMAWSQTLVHEWGHYGLDLKDEYETIAGGQDGMQKLKDNYPAIYPQIHGFMDNQWSTTEMSSANDYVQNLQYNCVGMWPTLFCATEQLACRGMSCWDQVEGRLEGWSSLVDIHKPPHGWFANGVSTSADLTGPNDAVGVEWYASGNQGSVAPPAPSIQIFDHGPGSLTAQVEVERAGRPLADARVYRVSDGTLIDLGRTDLRGRLEAVGLRDGEALRIYAREERGTARTLSDPILPARDGRTALQVALPSSAGAKLEDWTAPGAAFDLVPASAGETVLCRLELWSDEPLWEAPSVVAFCAGRIDTLVVETLPGTEHYQASLAVAPADTSFDGTGAFEIGMEDLAANRTDFVIPFRLTEHEANDDVELYEGRANANLAGASVPAAGAAVAAAGNPWPFRVAGFDATPVGEIFSIRLEPDGPFSAPGSLNILYNDSLLAGIDERSLRIRRWDPSGPAWLLLSDGGVQTEHNVVSGRLEEGGAYCIFAEELSLDVVPPGRVEDFGAVGTPGAGAIRLYWTATGDDDGVGAAEGYEIAYADSAFDATEWYHLPSISTGASGLAGSELSVTVQLPEPGHLYYLALRAIDEASNLSELSNLTYVVSGIADGNFLPAPPTAFRAVDVPGDDGGQVRLQWNLSCDDGGGKNTVTGYQVYRAEPALLVPQAIGVQPAGVTEFVDANAVSGQRYVYWVSATDGTAHSMAPENHAYAARNVGVPVGDFSSDAIVGVDDLARLLEGYDLVASDLEFEPLLDLDGDGQILAGDASLFEEGFGAGGLPSSDPPGENAAAILLREDVTGGGELRYLNLTIREASNLSGYSFRVDYPWESLLFCGASPDSEGVIPNILNEEGGATPCFVVREIEPGRLLIANALQRASAWIAPDGDGFVARLAFAGPGLDGVEVRDVVLLDHQGGLNLHPFVTAVEDGGTILRPSLRGVWPTPVGGPLTIGFQVPSRRKVTLSIYDVGGRLVRTVLNAAVAPGAHTVVWDGLTGQRRPVAAGVYFLRMESEGFRDSRKFVTIR